MRYYVLDDLVDPLCGRPLTLEGAEVHSVQGPMPEKCAHWCGFRARDPETVSLDDCRECGGLSVVSGTLVAREARYPVVNGIPRLTPAHTQPIGQAPELVRRVRESFGYEWAKFADILPEYDSEARNYLRLVPKKVFEGAIVLDAGCGMGRWARVVAQKPIRRLYSVDFSEAIDRAAETLKSEPSAHCVQADILHLPFRQGTFDLVYCLGVLHHLENPDQGMGSLVGSLRSRGSLLVYLYYALDGRPWYFRWLLHGVTLARRFTSRLPKPMMYGLAWWIGVTIYWPLARLALAFERLGLVRAAANIPLHHYRHYSVRLMVADAFDRFATPIEKRYRRDEIEAWFRRYGIPATFSNTSPYWVAYGQKPE